MIESYFAQKVRYVNGLQINHKDLLLIDAPKTINHRNNAQKQPKSQTRQEVLLGKNSKR
jgi:hypothetical protein